MLGVASEAAFYRLLDAFKNSVLIDARVKEKAEKLEKRISVTDKFNLVYDDNEEERRFGYQSCRGYRIQS
jgi:hypothetical protein